MEQGHTYLDHQLFTRNHRKNFPFTPTINYYQYPDFSSSHDMLWAKIQAMYRLIHYIREALEALKPGSIDLLQAQKHPILLWSGSKTALIELIYALYAIGDLNHGTAEIRTFLISNSITTTKPTPRSKPVKVNVQSIWRHLLWHWKPK